MSYTQIAKQTLAAQTNVFTFQNLPQTYSDLLVIASIRTTRANTDPGADLAITFNNDTAANYKVRGYEGNGNGSYGTSNFASSNSIGYILNVSSYATANTFGSWQMTIPNYTGSNTKMCAIDSASETNAAISYLRVGTGFWNSASAISRIDITDANSANFVVGSTVTIYGVNRIPTASLGTTPTVDYLVVAGGGTGGAYVGGGGGAGGLLAGSAFSVASGSAITVTVGAGGAGGASLNNGSNSSFSSITALGGGHGGQGGGGGLGGATSGGSGGGGGSSIASGLSGAVGTTGQGNAGGTSPGSSGSYPSGGGGGAGGAGVSPATVNTGGGAGGVGISSTYSGITTYYAGGGGGANSNTAGYQPGSGGLGGGGNGGLHNNSDGATITAGSAGLANTGGGGGGGGNSSASGGSGVVIIRYPDTYNAPTATTGNPMVNFVNGYRVYTWTASGTITF